MVAGADYNINKTLQGFGLPLTLNNRLFFFA
jgi:hypothetical protein